LILAPRPHASRVVRSGRASWGTAAAALLPLAVGAWLTGWIGVLLDGGASTLVLAVAVAAAYAAVTILLVAAAVAAASGNARMAVVGIVGALAAVFTLPEIEALTRGFVLSAPPATAARTAAIVSSTPGSPSWPRPCRPWRTSSGTIHCAGGYWPGRPTIADRC